MKGAAAGDRLGLRRQTRAEETCGRKRAEEHTLVRRRAGRGARQGGDVRDPESAVEGKTIIREGGYSNDFYVIEDGTVKVEREGEHLADLGPGDVFGEQGLLEKQERSATVTATSPVRLIKIEHWELARMKSAMPDVVDQLQRKGRGALALSRSRRVPPPA